MSLKMIAEQHAVWVAEIERLSALVLDVEDGASSDHDANDDAMTVAIQRAETLLDAVTRQPCASMESCAAQARSLLAHCDAMGNDIDEGVRGADWARIRRVLDSVAAAA